VVGMAVITAFELDDFCPSRESARGANSAHGRFCPAGYQPHLFARRDHGRDGFGHLHFDLCWGSESRSTLELAGDRLPDAWMSVSEYQRAPASDAVQVSIAVRIVDIGALSARNEQWVAAHRP